MISVPFVSFRTKQLYALPTISTAFRDSSSSRPFYLSPLTLSYRRFLLLPSRFCSSFSATFSSSAPSSLFLILLLLTDSTIRQIARTNDEPPGDPFRTLYTLLFPTPRVPGISQNLSYFKVFHLPSPRRRRRRRRRDTGGRNEEEISARHSCSCRFEITLARVTLPAEPTRANDPSRGFSPEGKRAVVSPTRLPFTGQTSFKDKIGIDRSLEIIGEVSHDSATPITLRRETIPRVPVSKRRDKD